jgi:hypothetical protein
LRESYRQVLPQLHLSIERHTPRVPDDGAWYLLQEGRRLGRFRSLKAAQKAWKEVVDSSGWTPVESEVDPKQIQLRERQENWARNRAG